MRKLIETAMISLIALGLLYQPAYARDHDGDHGRGNHYGWREHAAYEGYERHHHPHVTVYSYGYGTPYYASPPVAYYVPPPPPMAYYPRPVYYTQPVYAPPPYGTSGFDLRF